MKVELGSMYATRPVDALGLELQGMRRGIGQPYPGMIEVWPTSQEWGSPPINQNRD